MTDSTNHAVVSGGASGIGRALVHQLVERCMHVSVIDLPGSKLDEVASHGAVTAYQADVTDQPSLASVFEHSCERHGTPSHVFALAGTIGQRCAMLDMDIDQWRRLLDVHLFGTARLAQLYARQFVTSKASEPSLRGSFVATSSIVAAGGFTNQADYGTAKSAIAYLVKVLAVEWAPLGVRVNAIAPGFTETPMVDQLRKSGYDFSVVEERTPMGRLAQPDEIARAACYLALDAEFVTGQTLYVDGGWTAVGR